MEPELLARMCAALEHRGPDSRGIHRDGASALGIQRLRVIDLETGDQPIYNEDRSVAVVLNGEIYNYRELRAELDARGHRFATQGDTEVIAHLYEEHGADCVGRLHGMFAFALWDARRQQLLLARDRVGKKPLLYCAARRGPQLRLRAARAAAATPRSRARSTTRRSTPTSPRLRPGAADRAARRAQAAAGPHAACSRDGRAELERYWQLDYSHEARRRPGRGALRAGPRRAARRHPHGA